VREILAIAFEGDFEALVDRVGLGGEVPLECRLKCRRECKCDHPEGGLCEMAHALPAPVRLRQVLEKLGPTFVKLGQVLSIRPDLIPVEFTEELASLQDRAPTIPHEQICAIIEEELGAPPGELFAYFDETPLAAASLGQVHVAQLKKPLEGMGQTTNVRRTKVAVKVQRPGVREVVEKDLHILAYLAGLLEQAIPEARNYRPTRTVEEFAATASTRGGPGRVGNSTLPSRGATSTNSGATLPMTPRFRFPSSAETTLARAC
jgi:ubiquinone biosynthesis protein